MIKEIKLPAGGQTTDVSTIGSWMVKVGDKVKRGDVLLEIETDKATLPIESYTKGTVLAILAKEGAEMSAGEVVALIGDESDKEAAANWGKEAPAAAPAPAAEAPEAPAEAPAPAAPAAEEDEYQPIDKKAPRIMKDAAPAAEAPAAEAPAAAPAAPVKAAVPENIKAMPNAKKAAAESGVKLEDVAAFVQKDVIKKADVELYVKEGKAAAEAALVPAESAAPKKGDEHVKLTKTRKVIAKRMTESVNNVPSFQLTCEIVMDKLIALRKQVNDPKKGIKVSFNDILFKCIEAAIRKYPYINASFGDKEIIIHHDVNIGLAVGVDTGLVVPVVKNVGEKSIMQISAETKELIGKARERKLSLDDMSGGTITLSNLGMYPVTEFKAIINPPEACILALGCTEDKVIIENDEIKTVKVMKMTGSFDHRVLDGAYAAEFIGELKSIIEEPALALF